MNDNSKKSEGDVAKHRKKRAKKQEENKPVDPMIIN
jgi:hypothetical protein